MNENKGKVSDSTISKNLKFGSDVAGFSIASSGHGRVEGGGRELTIVFNGLQRHFLAEEAQIMYRSFGEQIQNRYNLTTVFYELLVGLCEREEREGEGLTFSHSDSSSKDRRESDSMR